MFLSQINSKAQRTFKHFFHKKAIDFLSNYKLDRPIPITRVSQNNRQTLWLNFEYAAMLGLS